MNTTRRLKWSQPESITHSTASNAQSTRWRQSALTAIAGSWGMAWKRMQKSTAAFIAHVPPVKQL
ncbi:MAG: hypothetical protein J2P56_10515 [Verrucomicrobia bacterium]|nr:hypothetical protein [Verrucomicrobiota bacterium]